MADSFFRGVRPSGGDAPQRYNVVSPPSSGKLDATILGTDVLGVPTHWGIDAVMKKHRSHLCAGDAEMCERCGVDPLQPLFFVAAWRHDGTGPGARIVLRLGREGAKALEACADRAGTLRGLRVEMYDTVGKAGRQIVCVASRFEPVKPLVSPHEIDRIVARLLKVATLPGWLTRREMERPEGGA